MARCGAHQMEHLVTHEHCHGGEVQVRLGEDANPTVELGKVAVQSAHLFPSCDGEGGKGGKEGGEGVHAGVLLSW